VQGDGLTNIELLVLQELATGVGNQETARWLVINKGTVKVLTNSIDGKLGVASSTEAAREANGLELGEAGAVKTGFEDLQSVLLEYSNKNIL
jgi:DNA-binding NarL/FixJ family response regulator